MKRKITDRFIKWKEPSERKPLLLKGARQTGKTYILKQFGKEFFPAYHCFDLMETPELHSVFKSNLKPSRIIRDLSIFIDKDINLECDLIIFDEIQACPEALTSLKYFAQEHPNAYICASGSLLGIGLNNSPFPVGKVTRCELYPMDFDEFLWALNQHRLVNLLNDTSLKAPATLPVHGKIWEFYKFFMITGGLPEAIKIFRDNFESLNTAFTKVRGIQRELFESYMDDISKHSGNIKAVKIQAVLKSIPIQLARENRTVNKFIFKDVLPNASRYSTLEAPIEWLLKAGLVIKVPITEKVAFPLQAYADKKRFKLYMFDVGILGAMLNLSPKVIFNYNYGSYKGYFAENIVLTEFISQLRQIPCSWSRNTSEVEFLLELDEQIIPVEVKAGINTKAKSLKIYKELYNPQQTFLLSGTPMDSMHKERLPIYFAGKLHKFVANN